VWVEEELSVTKTLFEKILNLTLWSIFRYQYVVDEFYLQQQSVLIITFPLIALAAGVVRLKHGKKMC